jgi:hypothetical protein
VTEEVPKLYCYNHPERETLLRCNNCERPICSECAVLTPTGYRCKECVRGQQKKFETAHTIDYFTTVVIAAALSFVGSLLVPILGFLIIFVGPIAGVIIAEAVRWATGRRRSKLMFQLAAGAAAAGSLPLLLPRFIPLLMGMSTFNILSLVWQGVYTFLVITTVYYRLSGIQIR